MYMPGGLVNNGSPYRRGTIQSPLSSISWATMARRLSVRQRSPVLRPYQKSKPLNTARIKPTPNRGS